MIVDATWVKISSGKVDDTQLKIIDHCKQILLLYALSSALNSKIQRLILKR